MMKISDEQMISRLAFPKGNPADGKIDVVLDTDTYNEIDDQFALSYLIKSDDRLSLKAIYAAPFFNQHSQSPADGMEKSYDEIFHLLELMGRKDLKSIVYKGSTSYLPSEQEGISSPAAEDLARRAMEYSKDAPLYVIAIGAITNIASAILRNPEIKERIVVVWLGGHSHTWPDTKEFNMMQDVAAARIIFGSGIPLIQLPCMGVVSACTTSGPELSYWLKGKNPLCDYLLKHTVEEAEAYESSSCWTRAIWDITAVAWLLDEKFTASRLVRAPIPEYDFHYAFDDTRHFMRYVYHVNRDLIFEDLFQKLTK